MHPTTSASLHSPVYSTSSQALDKAKRTPPSSGSLGTRTVKNFTSLMAKHFKLMKEGLKLSLNVSKSLYGMAKLALRSEKDDI